MPALELSFQGTDESERLSQKTTTRKSRERPKGEEVPCDKDEEQVPGQIKMRWQNSQKPVRSTNNVNEHEIYAR